MSWPYKGENCDPKAITDLVVAVRRSSCHLGVSGNCQLQAVVRVAIGSPEQSLGGGKDGGPCERNKRWNKQKRRAEGLLLLTSGATELVDI